MQFTDDELKLKAAFAAFLLQNPGQAFKAGLSVFPNDSEDHTRKALYVAMNWVNDDEVLKLMEELRNDTSSLPTKAEYARELWNTIQKLNPVIYAEERMKYMKLYAEVMAFIEKPQPQTNIQVNQNRVMVVKDMGTNDDWEKKAVSQQAALINASCAKH